MEFTKMRNLNQALFFRLFMPVVFCLALSSCEKDEPLQLREMLTQGQWRTTTLKLSPGVRMENSPTAPVIQDFISYYKENGIELLIYRFKSDGTFEETGIKGEAFRGTWSLSQDGKDFIINGEGYTDNFRVESFEKGVLHLSMNEIKVRDAYLNREVSQAASVVFKQFL